MIFDVKIEEEESDDVQASSLKIEQEEIEVEQAIT